MYIEDLEMNIYEDILFDTIWPDKYFNLDLPVFDDQSTWP